MTSIAALALISAVALAPTDSAETGLTRTVLEQDRQLFRAFNTCDLAAWRQSIAEDVEFYQDNDEVTTTRAALEPSFLDRCSEDGVANLRRELVSETVEVHPIQGYGAVQLGSHRFFVVADGRKELVAEPRFVHLWRHADGRWEITRVISYSH